MIPFNADRACIPSGASDPVTDLCWTAQEILMAHTRVPLERINCSDSDAGDTQILKDDEVDEDEENGDWITEVSTAPVKINLHQEVSLSNAPYILNDLGSLTLYAESGYVALLGDALQETSSQAPPFSNMSQLIFRVPSPYESAAIYNGITFDDNNQITSSDSHEIIVISRVLSAVRLGLRNLSITSPDVYESLYRSQIPSPVVSHFDQTSFDKIFGE